MKNKLIIFCPWGDVENTTILSGIPFYLIQVLKNKYDLIIVDDKNINSYVLSPFTKLFALFLKYSSKIIQRYSKQIYFQFTGVEISNCYILGKKLEKISYEYKYVPILTFGISATRFYKGNSRIYQYIDGIYSYKIDYYVNRNKLTEWELLNIKKTDLNGLRNSHKIFCSSETIKIQIIEFLSKNKGCLNVSIENARIGANIPEINIFRSKQIFNPINICFIYSNFFRKGGDIVLDIAKKCENLNFKFHFIGVTPDNNLVDSKNITFHGFVNKKNNLDKYLNIIRMCSINIMPTRGDLTPHIICECNAYGIPTIANNLGGIKDLLGDGGVLINGLLAEDYVKAIILVSKELSIRSKLSYEKYSKEQKWSIISEKLVNEIL